jgi:hypothetical protein
MITFFFAYSKYLEVEMSPSFIHKNESRRQPFMLGVCFEPGIQSSNVRLLGQQGHVSHFCSENAHHNAE